MTEKVNDAEKVTFVNATAVIDSCPYEHIDYVNDVQKVIFKEQHMRNNIAAVNFEHQSTRGFRGNLFTHTVSVILTVKTSALWDSPRQYIWKHLGQEEWARNDGTRIKFSRIHVK